MANFVIKKSGEKEPFDAEKIKNAIRAAARGTEVEEERVNQVVEQVSGVVLQMAGEKEEIATSELRDKILSELDSIEPDISASWRRHNQEQEKV